MAFYAARRLAILALTLAVASLIVFAALEILPGNAAETMLGASATPEAVAALAHKLGLDRPFAARYLAWIGGALHGDLGASYAYGSPIAALIGQKLAVTLPLTFLAMAIATAVALTAGVYAAERRGRGGDAAVMVASQFGLAIPNFWFGILLVLLFSVHWRLFPSGGFPGWDDPAVALKALLLPALALGLVQGAILTRVTRSALVEAMGEDFMRTARAKGLSRTRALWRHALPNAAPPILAIAGLQFSTLIAGAVVVENVFTLPGLGRLIAQSIANRDVLVVEDCVMLLVALVILVAAAVDVAAAAIDPRLRGGVTSLRLGLFCVGVLVAAALVSLVWTPYSPTALDVAHKLSPPSAAHWLGLDSLGRDVASEILAGARVSLLVGVIAVGIGLVFGVALGLFAASVGGVVEDAIMKASDFAVAFPALLLAILLTSTYGPGVVNAIAAIGIANVPVFAKLTRAAANGVLAREYALAARAAGRGPTAIAFAHVLPNIAAPLIVQATIQFAIAILAEAALSYLGLGAQPPMVSWGRMLADAQVWLWTAPRLSVFPGVAVAFAVLGLNLLGDGLRDALDPKLRARS